MGFCSLQHVKDPRSTDHGLSLPATVRLQGLVTLLAACSLESRAGFISHRQRSWDSPFGGFPSQEVLPAFRPEASPHTVCPGSISAARRRQTGLTGRGYWARTSRECLAFTRSFNPATAGASHGVCPFRVCYENLEPGLLRISSHTLRGLW
jgi:hypothetical protein